MKLFVCLFLLCVALCAPSARADARKPKYVHGAPALATQTTAFSSAEARLIEIYRLIGKSETQVAIKKAEHLVKDFPNFQLAQLVYGDLLSSRVRVVKSVGDVPVTQHKQADHILQDLHDESRQRIKALRERPPAGSIPSEFMLLSARSRYAMAVDASRSRLYLFDNQERGLTLIADFYISIGKSGLEKMAEGDLRTPLGVYFITSRLNPSSLKDYYGAGALPINYPNVLDTKRGKTGSGIWLHGTPQAQFSRPPLASDGCIVLSNPDLKFILKTVKINHTPVIISKALKWVAPHSVRIEANRFQQTLKAWVHAKNSGQIKDVAAFYASDFISNGKSLAEWLPTLEREVSSARGRTIELKDLSLLHWTDASNTMLVSFGEVQTGQRSGVSKRQYWARQNNQWKIFFEGVI